MEHIRIENLTYKFKENDFEIGRVDLIIEKGEFVLFAGRNGSGKTTLLRHINGLIIPDKGDVYISGISVKKNPKKARELVGMIFQDADTQIVGETVYEDTAFGPENLRMERDHIDERVKEALDAVGLTGFEDKRPHSLSGGEKRRLSIAGILSMKPEIIIFDEPFSNLDYDGISQVLEYITLLIKEKKTVLMATHDLEKVITYADKIVIMDKGRITDCGTPGETSAALEKFGVFLSSSSSLRSPSEE